MLEIFLLYLEVYLNGITLFSFLIHLCSHMWLLLIHFQHCQVYRFPLYEYIIVGLSMLLLIDIGLFSLRAIMNSAAEIFPIISEVKLMFVGHSSL